MKKKLVRYTLETLPPLTDAQRASLKALSARPDGEIDTSDIPVLTDAEWARTKRVRGHIYRPIKRIVTARLDGVVLDWLRSRGKGYRSRMNAILRREMLSSLKSATAKWVHPVHRQLLWFEQPFDGIPSRRNPDRLSLSS